ncbi:saccharopine dehydrogenase NADP-binding domain-containing protein [Pseudomonas sp. ADAK13]|uniref:saccharopine dehydrogenase NADP-binding domain-containing protein n=1 Tax=Pseudomonas sp. ADAK13 TaxID=2730847 RepID=UPI001463B29E|nr:saccharopine dehydrogenase NADP-binding domain-containing protein [Pseudomonas sp. ADAK13]QJI37722.1 saccharopine dehydrogenase [Pseudomonas sp. ADAK13]
MNVGIVGGYGHVGRQVARVLVGHYRLRLGGRDPGQGRRFNHRELNGRAEVRELDLWDARSLAAFCSGCELVINCAGPSYKVLDRVALAALASGADYLDVGGDDPLHHVLPAQLPPGRRVVLSAGMLPGLSGLFPKVLAASFERVDTVRCYAVGLGRLSTTAAEDFLLSLGNGYGQASMGWAEGRAVKSAVPADEHFERPWLVGGAVTAYPYLTTEQQRLFTALRVPQAEGYNLFDGGHLRAALGRIQGSPPALRHSAENVASLVQASALDLAGRTPYQLLAVEMEGLQHGEPQQASAWLRAGDGSALTGTVAAICALQWARLPKGTHYAAQVMDADDCLRQVLRWLPHTRIHVTTELEEGVL